MWFWDVLAVSDESIAEVNDDGIAVAPGPATAHEGG